MHEVGGQRRVYGLSDDLERVLVRCLHGLDPQGLLKAGVDRDRVLQAGLDLLGGHLGAVVELDPLADGEGPVLGIGGVPLLSEPRPELQSLRVEAHQGLNRAGVEDKGGLDLMRIGGVGRVDRDEPQGLALRALVRGHTAGAEEQGDGSECRGQPGGRSFEHGGCSLSSSSGVVGAQISDGAATVAP